MGYQVWEHCPDLIYRIIKIYLKFIYTVRSDFIWLSYLMIFALSQDCAYFWSKHTFSYNSGHLTDTSSVLLTGTLLFQNFTLQVIL